VTKAAGEIPPGSALIFDVELIDFKPTPPPAAPAEAAPAGREVSAPAS
jgi:hypothetical protein